MIVGCSVLALLAVLLLTCGFCVWRRIVCLAHRKGLPYMPLFILKRKEEQVFIATSFSENTLLFLVCPCLYSGGRWRSLLLYLCTKQQHIAKCEKKEGGASFYCNLLPRKHPVIFFGSLWTISTLVSYPLSSLVAIGVAIRKQGRRPSRRSDLPLVTNLYYFGCFANNLYTLVKAQFFIQLRAGRDLIL